MLYSNLTYLLVARHVENDELALPFILEIKLRLQGLLLNILYWYTYSFEIYF